MFCELIAGIMWLTLPSGSAVSVVDIDAIVTRGDGGVEIRYYSTEVPAGYFVVEDTEVTDVLAALEGCDE